MILMKRALPDLNLPFAAVLFAACLLTPIVSLADAYLDARASMISAYQAEDYASMREYAEAASAARPGFAGGLFNLALAQALDSDPEASLATLERLLLQRVDFGVANLEEFATLQTLTGWDDYEKAVADLYEPVGSARVAYTLERSDFIPEGIAINGSGDLYLGSIRHGDIVRVAAGAKTLLTAKAGPHWSVYGMRLHEGKLWYVSSAVAQFAGLDDDYAGRTGLFAMDLASGELTTRAYLPKTAGQQVLGDLEFVDDDTLVLADQTDGVVYRYDLNSKSFSTLVSRGVLGSPQGLALDESGNHVYIADYIGGLARVELKSGAIVQVESNEAVSLYGIDGLYAYKGRLIAIQNGIRPHRVVELSLDAAGTRITGSRILAMNLPEFDEPNLGQVQGDKFYFIANSHWNRFDNNNSLPDELSGPIILEVDLKNDQAQNVR